MLLVYYNNNASHCKSQNMFKRAFNNGLQYKRERERERAE